MQNKTRVRYHLTLSLKTIIKMSTDNKCWRGFVYMGTFKHQWWECKLVWPLWMTVQRFLIKLKTELAKDPAVLYLGKIIIQNIHVHQDSLQHYLKYPRNGSKVSVHLEISG